MTQSADLPVLEIVANAIEPPPAWAVMEDAALSSADRYGRPDGTPHNVQDVADAYEAHSYRGMLYSLGGRRRHARSGEPAEECHHPAV